MQNESLEMHSRLDDLEDRSRRENLIFYGLADTSTETWSQSEEAIRNFASSTVEIEIPSDSIARAHRLGNYIETKCRPTIVRFSSSKVRNQVFSSKSKLKGTGISVAEDFCKSTRH